MFLDEGIPLVIGQPKLFCFIQREKKPGRQPVSNSSAKDKTIKI